jgi:hypothetical protein
VLEIVIGARIGRIQRSELGEELQARLVELESVVGGHERPLESRAPFRFCLETAAEALDFLLVLSDGGLELRARRGPTVGGRRPTRPGLLAVEHHRRGTCGIERATKKTDSGLLVAAAEYTGRVDGSHRDSTLAIPVHGPVQ